MLIYVEWGLSALVGIQNAKFILVNVNWLCKFYNWQGSFFARSKSFMDEKWEERRDTNEICLLVLKLSKESITLFHIALRKWIWMIDGFKRVVGLVNKMTKKRHSEFSKLFRLTYESKSRLSYESLLDII